MKSINLFFSALFIALSASPAFSSELDSELKKTAQKLFQTAVDRNLTASTLAVFPFQADEKLSRKRVNFAVSEMLTTNLIKGGAFTVIERSQLEEVMKEQKLGLSGALDSKTAASVGKLMGAKLLVLGNVIQVGNSYQITSKLVNSETGEIISSEMNEVPVKIFDEDAGRYLVLVPEYQAIGLYFVFGYGPITVKRLPPVSSGGTMITPLNPDADSKYVGGVVRYFLSPQWMVDAAVIPIVAYKDSPIFNDSKAIVGTSIDGTIIRLLVDRIFGLSGKFRVHAGAGAMSMRAFPANQGGSDRVSLPRMAYVTPLVRAGLEWKPQARLGWAVFTQYNVSKKDYKIHMRDGALVRQFTFPQILVETTLSLYF